MRLASYLKINLFLLIFVFTINLEAQNIIDTVIYWDKDRKLNWQDFKGKISRKTNAKDYKASSSTSIKSVSIREGEEFKFLVFACFYKEESWTVDTTSSELLDHEQLHFDIIELYARMIRKSISIQKRRPDANAYTFNKTFKSYQAQIAKTNDEYDRETQHGIDLKRQEAWDKKIRKELRSFENYSVRYDNLVLEAN